MPSFHHYITEFYLKNFTDIKTPNNQEHYCWVYNSASNKCYKKSPGNLAGSKNRYTINQNGKMSNTIESEFSKIESESSKVFRKIIRNNELLDVKEKMTLSCFMTTLIARSPIKIREYNENREKFYKEIIPRLMSNIIQFNTPIFDSDGKQISHDRLKENYNYLTNSDNFEINFNDLQTTAEIMKVEVLLLNKLLPNMKWEYLVAKDDVLFVTSDYPSWILNLELISNMIAAGKHVELTFPISRGILLKMSPNGLERFRKIDNEEVIEYNLRTTLHAKEIYSPCQKTLDLLLSKMDKA